MTQTTKHYQEVILDSMARTLWLLAYADWADRREEEGEDEDAEGGGELEVARPGPGGDWDGHAPETPLAAIQAAGDLYTLVKESLGLQGENALGHLFEQAMATHLGELLVPDKEWIKQIKAEKYGEQRAVIMVYADWLEQQGRVHDARYVRGTVPKKYGFPIVDRIVTGREGDATRFGGTLVHMAEGTGVSWEDDYKVANIRTHDAPDSWTRRMPHFESYYDGEHLSWSGRVRDKEWDAPGAHRQGNQQARYEEGDPPVTQGPEEIGADIGPAGQRQVIIVNANDKSWTKHSFVLWFGTTNLLIYANSLEDALDEGVDWLVDNEPGQLVDDQVNEQFQELLAERAAAGTPVEEGTEEYWNVLQEAEEDTTPGGNASNRVARNAWGIQMEDPSERDLLLFTGLIKNPPRKKKPPAPPPSPYDQLATVMFRDTVTARMLRELAQRGQMTQAEFMRDYMRRCERPPSRWQAEAAAATRRGYDRWGVTIPKDPEAEAVASFSGFNNNFGRYVARGGFHFTSSTLFKWHVEFWNPRQRKTNSRLYLIRKESIPPKAKASRSQYGAPVRSQRNLIHWVGPPVDELLSKMSPAKLQWAFENLEFQMIGKPRATDTPEEVGWWLERIRPLLGPKQNPSRPFRISARHYVPVDAPPRRRR